MFLFHFSYPFYTLIWNVLPNKKVYLKPKRYIFFNYFFIFIFCCFCPIVNFFFSPLHSRHNRCPVKGGLSKTRDIFLQNRHLHWRTFPFCFFQNVRFLLRTLVSQKCVTRTGIEGKAFDRDTCLDESCLETFPLISCCVYGTGS